MLPRIHLIILSLGLGIQSTTMSLLLERGLLPGVPRPDYGIFADTFAEPPHVYETREWLRELVSFPIVTCSFGDIARNTWKAITGQPVPETAQQPEPEILLTPLQAAQAAEVLDGMAVKVLLEAWLQLKSDLLADGTRAAEISAEQLNRLVQLAAPNLAEAVRNQRRLLHQRGERLVVQATPMVITMLEPGPDRITARVVLEYAETTVDAQGTATARSGPKTLSNDYVFARTSAGWKLQGFGPSPSP